MNPRTNAERLMNRYIQRKLKYSKVSKNSLIKHVNLHNRMTHTFLHCCNTPSAIKNNSSPPIQDIQELIELCAVTISNNDRSMSNTVPDPLNLC